MLKINPNILDEGNQMEVLEFCHDECFEKNENIGTYEDLVRGAKEYNEIHNEQ